MQPEEAERQTAKAIASAPHHVQLAVERRELPGTDALDAGRTTGRLWGEVVAVFRSFNDRIDVGHPIEIQLPYCMPGADMRFALIGGFTIIHDDLIEATYVEAVLDEGLAVTCALVSPVTAPTQAPHFVGTDIAW